MTIDDSPQAWDMHGEPIGPGDWALSAFSELDAREVVAVHSGNCIDIRVGPHVFTVQAENYERRPPP